MLSDPEKLARLSSTGQVRWNSIAYEASNFTHRGSIAGQCSSFSWTRTTGKHALHGNKSNTSHVVVAWISAALLTIL
jgi:hypothetical protein